MVYDYNGLKVRYEVFGSGGQNVLTLHGWGGCIDSFKPVINRLSTGKRVFALDFPGHGNTAEPPAPWSVTEYMQMTEAFIRDVIGGQTDIVAHSFGCRVAILLSAEHPQLVNRLVLTGAAGIPSKKTGKKTFKSRLYKTLKKLVLSKPAKMLLGGKTTDKLQEALIQRFGSPDYRVLSKNMRMTFNRVIAQDLTGKLKDIQASVILLWGENDTETPLWMGEIMEREIRDCALVKLNGGHFAYLDDFGKFIAVTESFLN